MAETTPAAPQLERKIGGTLYIVTAQYAPTATENAAKKIRRVIMKEIQQKVLKNGK